MVRAVALAMLLAACGDVPSAGEDRDASSVTDVDASKDVSDSPDATPADPVLATIEAFVGEDRSNLELVVMHQGDGPWKPLAGIDGVYSLSVAPGRYGIAWVCPSMTGEGAVVMINRASTDDGIPPTIGCIRSERFPVTGTVTGMEPGDHVDLQVYGDSDFLNANGSFELSQRAGVWDVMVAHYRADIDTYEYRVERGIEFGPDAPTMEIDASLAGTTTGPVEVTPTGETFAALITPGLAYAIVSGDPPSVFPEEALAPGDLHYFAQEGANATHEIFRHAAGALAFDVPLADVYPTFDLDMSGNDPVPVADVVNVPGDAAVEFVARQTIGDRTVSWTLVTSAEWSGGTAYRTIRMPDLETLDEWPENWTFGVAGPIEVSARAWRSNQGFLGVVTRYPREYGPFQDGLERWTYLGDSDTLDP